MDGQLLLGSDHLVAVFPFDKEVVARVKKVRGATWDNAGKAWRIPLAQHGPASALALELGWWIAPEVATLDIPGSKADAMTISGAVVSLAFGFDPVKVRAVKRIPGITWNKKTMAWVAPLSSLSECAEWAEQFNIPVDDDTRTLVSSIIEKRELLIEQSRLTDADVDVAGLPLLPYQRAGVKYASEARRCFIADDMGLGKTLQAIATLERTEAYPAVVICPPTLVLNWAKEYEKWLPNRKVATVKNRSSFPDDGYDVVVVGYSNIHAWVNRLQKHQAYVFDESHYCFPGDTQVATLNGFMTIQEIFETDEDVYVASCGSWSSAIVYNRVVNKFKLTSHELVKVVHEHGEFICTPDHRVLTQFGYREASSLTQYCYLRVLPETVPSKEGNKQVLLQIMQGNSDSIMEEDGEHQHRVEATGRAHKDDGKQSDALRANAKESIRDAKANGTQTYSSGGEWSWSNEGSTHVVGSIRRWLANRICSILRKTKTSGIADSLQDRYSEPFRNEGNRGRWGFPQDPLSERKGQQEDSLPFFSRVVSVEVYERADREPVGNGSAFYSVYDIEVEETHTFFADGILVSNCKSPDAQRTKAAVKLARTAPQDGVVLCLTGTPVTNRPAEYAPQLDILGKLSDFGGKWGFYRRYCNAFQDRFGQWNISGNSNLDELNNRLRGNCYIRRTKEQVLDELPPVRHDVVIVEGGEAGLKEYRKAEADIVRYMMERARQIAEELGESPNSASVRAKMRAERNEHLVRIGVLRKLAAKAKMGAVIEWVESRIEAGNKVVIAAHHREIVDELASKYGNLKIQGGMDVVDVERNKQMFQEGTVLDSPVMVLSIQAAKTGHTLTASQDVLFVELPWNWADVEQTYSRCHRLGQKGSVTATYLLCQNTIDEKIYDLIGKKREVVSVAVEGNDAKSASQGVFDSFIGLLN